MSPARTIVAVLVALAVALLPASGGAAFAAKHDAMHGHAAVEIMATADTDHATPCDHGTSAVDDCGSISVCALKCFTYAGVRLPTLAAPLPVSSALPFFVTEIADLAAGVPPFRPPRA